MGSETSLSYHNAIRCHNPEYLDLNLHQCENLKCHVTIGFNSKKMRFFKERYKCTFLCEVEEK